MKRILAWLALVVVDPLPAQDGKEQKAIEQLRKMNVGLQFDEQSPQRPLVGVDCSQVQFTDIGFKHIRQFPTIQRLNLSKTLITDAGMRNLRELTELQELTLDQTAITSAGLESISDLPKLWLLNIDSCQKLDAEAFLAIREMKALKILIARGIPIYDKSLEYWAAERPVHEPPTGSKTKPRKLKVSTPNPSLVTIYLSSTQKITDVGAEHIANLPTLMEITLSDSAISAKTIQRFARLPVLRTLNVSSSPNLGDDALAILQDFQALKACWFAHTPVTDAGLKHVERAMTLQSISVQQSKVTQAGVDALRAARPELTVEF